MTFLTKKHVSFHRIVAKSNRFPIILPFKEGTWAFVCFHLLFRIR